ncbi:hypothetical protein BGX29_009824 [Mortierella sp. GBA35]|nr:hypothetical protein BGX23_011691 [Mortierella sp. AD031]KAF9093720.1 hypothetical protein BGX29_009824 [Mortierella sp. GBA35]KAG0208694.1 hypothetical protein BGX33_006070 [Mortierella sp. NVP41]
MKLTAAAVLASCAPSLGFALVGNEWKFDSAPSGGLNDVTFPFNIANAPHQMGFYFAQQFNFKNVAEVGYTGLQPRSDSNGNSVVHAAFSSFQDGTTSDHPNCSDGADGGPGVSCFVDINGDYSHTYNLVVENTSGTTWRGTLVDSVTGDSTVVGEWTLPYGSGKLVNGQVGFVEYYIWNGQPSHTCNSLPFTEATFYNPTSKTSGASGGKITSVYEYGDCVSKAGYSTTTVSGGYDIKVGF